MDIAVYDDDGNRLHGQMGELVCATPFPSTPLGFLNDPDDERFRAAYFNRFPGVWHHGDLVSETEHGGFIIYGRSDAVLNPGGIRIGTAEIYRPVEAMPEISEALAIGQRWNDDTRIVLFVTLQDEGELDDELALAIRSTLRKEASPRHVPAKIVQVPELPRTKSGKIVELAVREVVEGRPVKNVEALANPDALEHFRNLPELTAD
jgi:acetoacetyl-CoA synthetase